MLGECFQLYQQALKKCRHEWIQVSLSGLFCLIYAGFAGKIFWSWHPSLESQSLDLPVRYEFIGDVSNNTLKSPDKGGIHNFLFAIIPVTILKNGGVFLISSLQ